MNWKEITKDWITIGCEKASEKGKQLGHKTKMKIHKPTARERLNQYNKPKLRNPFKKRYRLSY